MLQVILELKMFKVLKELLVVKVILVLKDI